MKKIYTKIPVIVGMLVNIVSASMFIAILDLEPGDRGKGLFLLGLSFLGAVISYFLYFADAIISIIKAIMKINPIINIVLALVILIPIPVAFAINIVSYELLIVCNCLIFLLEIVSIIIHKKYMCDSSKRG